MASAQRVVFPNAAQSSGPSTSDTVSPSAYEREVVEVTPDFTSVTNSRERFVVVAMSALLLLISVTLFAVLFTLLSDDIFSVPTVLSSRTVTDLRNALKMLANGVFSAKIPSASEGLEVFIAFNEHFHDISASLNELSNDLSVLFKLNKSAVFIVISHQCRFAVLALVNGPQDGPQ
ncbi:hypothetical protein MTO96_050516 [Rhipicephalus appendiculatus]